MLRAIVTVVGILVAGVAIAFGLAYLGCIGANPPFASVCGHNVFGAILVLSIAAWFVLGTIVVGIRAYRNDE